MKDLPTCIIRIIFEYTDTATIKPLLFFNCFRKYFPDLTKYIKKCFVDRQRGYALIDPDNPRMYKSEYTYNIIHNISINTKYELFTFEKIMNYEYPNPIHHRTDINLYLLNNNKCHYNYGVEFINHKKYIKFYKQYPKDYIIKKFTANELHYFNLSDDKYFEYMCIFKQDITNIYTGTDMQKINIMSYNYKYLYLVPVKFIIENFNNITHHLSSDAGFYYKEYICIERLREVTIQYLCFMKDINIYTDLLKAIDMRNTKFIKSYEGPADYWIKTVISRDDLFIKLYENNNMPDNIKLIDVFNIAMKLQNENIAMFVYVQLDEKPFVDINTITPYTDLYYAVLNEF